MQKLLRRTAQATTETALATPSDSIAQCFECGGSLGRRLNQPYQYLESGLKNVWLTGITVHHCRRCRARHPEIPAIERLHDLIADAIVHKEFTLAGAEFRFLRKRMRLRAKEIAAFLGVTLTTISRWETQTERIGPANDRLMRCLYVLWQLKTGGVAGASHLFDSLQRHFMGLSSRPRTMQITVKSDALKGWSSGKQV